MITLHAHSNFTLLRGTIRIQELVDAAKKMGSRYVSLTDTNGMYGLIQFYKAAADAGLKPILGTHINDPEDENLQAVFLAKNRSGYSKLCKIITARKLKDNFSLKELFLTENLEDVFVLTSSLDLLKNMEFYPGLRKNLYVELIITEKQKRNTRDLYNFAKENNLQIVASHPAYFLKPDDYELHKVVCSIRENKAMFSLEPGDTEDAEYYLKSPEEMKELWKPLPDAIWNIDKIVKECNVDLEFGKFKFPRFPLPPGETAFSYLWKICFKGLEEKYKPITEKAVKRMQYELDVIDELGYTDYFLVVWDIVGEAHRRQMVTIGRGSAANSLVAYCLNLTQVDPIEHNLYFERFLNRGRTSPPDVDLDFSWRERDDIVKYVYEKYGYDKVAMISTTVTFRARSAFRQTAKAFGFKDEEISPYSKYIPWTSAENLPNLKDLFPESRSFKMDSEPWSSIIKLAARLAGFPQHLSIHPGGIVIGDKPITEYLALEYAANKGIGLIVTQPDMYPVEDLGLVKLDLLSQRSLGVLRDTLLKINTQP